jgi:hypothetical protein
MNNNFAVGSPGKTQVAVLTVFPIILSLVLTGCWTPPNANVQPKGEPRLIQSGVSATDYHARATVQTVDIGARVLGLKLDDGTMLSCTVGPLVPHFDQIQPGDRIKVTLAEKLAVYVLRDGRMRGADGQEETIPFIARVQTVDPSYRLLTIQYRNGQTTELKTDLDAKLLEMQPGDAVVLQSAEATEIRIEK